MVASRQLEIPYYRGVGRQRGRGFGAFAQVIGRTAIPILRKYIVPAAKRVGADLLELAAPEIREVISGRKSFKSAAKSVGKQTLKKQLGEGSRSGGSKQKRIIPTKSTEQSNRSRRDIFTKISRWTCQTKIFGTNLLWQCLEILEGKSQLLTMSSHEQEIYPTTSLGENCTKFEFQTDRNYYVGLRHSFLALKLKFVKGLGYDTYVSKEKKKSTKMSLLFLLKQAMTQRKKK